MRALSLEDWFEVLERVLDPSEHKQVLIGISQVIQRIVEARILTASELSDVRMYPGIYGVDEIEVLLRTYMSGRRVDHAFTNLDVVEMRVQLHEGFSENLLATHRSVQQHKGMCCGSTLARLVANCDARHAGIILVELTLRPYISNRVRISVCI